MFDLIAEVRSWLVDAPLKTNVHPAAPLTRDHKPWTDDQPLLRHNLDRLKGPTLVLGDFNATLDHQIMRDLITAGYRDASADAGAGLNRTWPQGRSLIPLPMFAIDHVLQRYTDLLPQNATTHVIPGSDHLALIVRLGQAPV